MWAVARTIGADYRSISRAATDIRRKLGHDRHGDVFYPELRSWFVKRGGKEEAYRSRALMPSYLFIRLRSPADRDCVVGSIYTPRQPFLGSYDGAEFRPAAIPDSYVAELIDHGPFNVGRRLKAYAQFERGQKVRRVLSAICEFIGEVEGVSPEGVVSVAFDLFGKRHVQKFRAEQLETV